MSVVGLDRDDDALAAAAQALARAFGDRVMLRRSSFDRVADDVSGVGRRGDHRLPLRPRRELAAARSCRRVASATASTARSTCAWIDARPCERTRRRERPRRARAWPRCCVATVTSASPLGSPRAIVAARPSATTIELAEIVRDAIPAATRRSGGHPAKRTFQAIRIEVNRELDAAARRARRRDRSARSQTGRGAVLSYHSGEDRVVKRVFADAATGGCTCPPRLPCQCGARARVKLLWRGGHTPHADELARNARAQSARLRAVERLPQVAGAA